MVKVITYGTFDYLHHGHIRLLERAKALGDYLIVGVTADDFDKTRGKINVRQSLMERVEAVRATGLADEIIIEEYEGQKIDDIRKYDIDIFTVGSDWEGRFDYLRDYCRVVYLERTEGISSSDIRDEKRHLRLGIVGNSAFLNKICSESRFVNGIDVTGVCTDNIDILDIKPANFPYEELIENVDAVYIRSLPNVHYEQIVYAIEHGKHVLCESPVCLSASQTGKLYELAKNKGVCLMTALKTAYATAYNRLLLLIKSGIIGKVVSVDATCTSLCNSGTDWPGIFEWGPTALLPVFQILGTDYIKKDVIAHFIDNKDSFTKMDFVYRNAVASIKVGDGVKSEGELIISGTTGYIYVPAPWWKTDYFEVRYENPSDNRRFFYQLDGEGIRYELVAFVQSIENGKPASSLDENISIAISQVMQDYTDKDNITII